MSNYFQVKDSVYNPPTQSVLCNVFLPITANGRAHAMYCLIVGDNLILSLFIKQERSYIHYENACSCRQPDQETFLRTHAQPQKRKLVFCSRPVVSRNMDEFEAYAPSEAVRRGILPEDEREYIGIGLATAPHRCRRALPCGKCRV